MTDARTLESWLRHNRYCDVAASADPMTEGCTCGLSTAAAEADTLRSRVAALEGDVARLQFAAHQLARHPGHPKDCALPDCQTALATRCWWRNDAGVRCPLVAEDHSRHGHPFQPTPTSATDEARCGCGAKWTAAVHDPLLDPEVVGFHAPFHPQPTPEPAPEGG